MTRPEWTCSQERFFHDWRRILQLGVVQLIVAADDDGLADDDGDGVPDEVRAHDSA